MLRGLIDHTHELGVRNITLVITDPDVKLIVERFIYLLHSMTSSG